MTRGASGNSDGIHRACGSSADPKWCNRQQALRNRVRRELGEVEHLDEVDTEVAQERNVDIADVRAGIALGLGGWAGPNLDGRIVRPNEAYVFLGEVQP